MEFHGNFSIVETQSEYIQAYNFEILDWAQTISLMRKFRPVLALAITLYLLGIYFGQRWMKNRPAYKLTGTLFLWNAGLAIFSIISTIRGFPESAHILAQPDGGIYKLVCTRDVTNHATLFWGLMFALSKFVELGDTAFIVLRKQKLIFLHWYHHILVLLVSWFGFEFLDSFGRMYIINTFVHSWMYSYYALRALNIKIPRNIAIFITTIQIGQMILGCYLNIFTLKAINDGLPCGRDPNYIYGILWAGVTFLILFINFFLHTYVFQAKKKIQ